MQVNDIDVSADASAYVRACGEPEALGHHPAWIPLLIAGGFLQVIPIQIACGIGIMFIIYAKRKNCTIFDLLRRIRRMIAGKVRKPFRSC